MELNMKLRSLLRKWLGITSLEFSTAIISRGLRKEIADAMDIVLTGDNGTANYAIWGEYFPKEGRRFESTLRRVTNELAAEKAKELVESRIGGEAFIDEVVERLRRKQL